MLIVKKKIKIKRNILFHCNLCITIRELWHFETRGDGTTNTVERKLPWNGKQRGFRGKLNFVKWTLSQYFFYQKEGKAKKANFAGIFSAR